MPALQSLPALAPVAGVLTLLELGAGAVAVAWLIDMIGHVGRGFRGTTTAIGAVLIGIALLTCAQLPDPRTILNGGDAATFATAVHWTVALLVLVGIDVFFSIVGTDGARHVVGAITAVVGVVAVGLLAAAFAPIPGATPAAVFTALSGALLCGAALTGMLLGHWYLIAPDLTFKPLRQAVYIVFGAVLVEVMVIIGGLIEASSEARTMVLGGSQALLFWLLVVGSGIVFTAAVNTLTLHFARIRANQPATAMLYALIVSVLMGVVPAALVFLQTGVAL